jgi:hypothetical protein
MSLIAVSAVSAITATVAVLSSFPTLQFDLTANRGLNFDTICNRFDVNQSRFYIADDAVDAADSAAASSDAEPLAEVRRIAFKLSE